MRRLLDDEDDEDGHGIDDEEPHDSDAVWLMNCIGWRVITLH